jgi:penicillin-insensitive murein endopeptidase
VLIPTMALVLAATSALATGRSRRRREPPRPPSLSMGYANSGRLRNPARLEEDETIRYLPGRPLHYGTDELVGLIRRVAAAVHRRHHVRLSVGDLSAAGGGPVGHHASHQSGRDADLAFFVLDRRGRSVTLDDYVSFARDGRAMQGGALRFDVARNWALVEALVDDPQVRVEHIFVANGLRALLLAHARATGVSAGTLARAEAVMHQPVHASPHANHFHVRIACPSGDDACIEGIRPPPRPRRHRRATAHPSRHHHDGRTRAAR